MPANSGPIEHRGGEVRASVALATIALLAVSATPPACGQTKAQLLAIIDKHAPLFTAVNSYRLTYEVEGKDLVYNKSLFNPRKVVVTENWTKDAFRSDIYYPLGMAVRGGRSSPATSALIIAYGVALRSHNNSHFQICDGVLPQFYQNHYYTDYLGIDLYATWRTPPGRTKSYHIFQPFLPEFTRANESTYEIASATETIDRRTCHILEWRGVDKIWLDAGAELVVKREVRWKKDGELAVRAYYRDYQPAVHGLRLPRTVFVDLLPGSQFEQRADLLNTVITELTITVKEWEFNKVNAAVFRIAAKPGSSVADEVNNLSYSIPPPGVNPVDVVVNSAVRPQIWRSRWVFLSFSLLAATTLGVGLFWAIRKVMWS